MKKLILVLMPIIVILAFYGYYLDNDLNFTTFLNGLSTINFKDFNYNSILDAFNNLNFANAWDDLRIIWENVDGLIDFFSAIGDSFIIYFNVIIDFFKTTYNVLIFSYEFLSYLFVNLFELIKFFINFIFS